MSVRNRKTSSVNPFTVEQEQLLRETVVPDALVAKLDTEAAEWIIFPDGTASIYHAVEDLHPHTLDDIARAKPCVAYRVWDDVEAGLWIEHMKEWYVDHSAQGGGCSDIMVSVDSGSGLVFASLFDES